MLHVSIVKMHESGWTCGNPDCQHDPEYNWHVIGSVYHIKAGSLCAMTRIGNGPDSRTEFYCRPCIDEVYKMIKSKLDTKLWAFQ